MALLFMDGFEQYASSAELAYSRYYATSAMPARWGYVSGTGHYVDNAGYKTSQPGGVTSKSYNNRMSAGTSYGFAALYLPATTTLIVGFAYQVSILGSPIYLRFGGANTSNWSASNSFLTFQFGASGQVTLYNNRTGITLISTPASTVLANNWYYIELKIVFGATGSAELKIDGLSVGTATSVDTRHHTSDSAFNQLGFGAVNVPPATVQQYFDDLYVCDGTGATHNDFLGPVSVYTLFPSANGTTNQFTPTGVASNWDAVNEQAADTVTYVSSSTANHVDKYNVTDLPVSPTTIHAVAVGSMGSKSETNARQFRNTVTVGGTTSNGATATPAFSIYNMSQDLFLTAPGGSAWTASDVNSMEIGVECL